MSNPLVAQAQDSTRWYTGLGLVEDVAGVCSGIHDNSWVDVTLGGVGGALDMLSVVVDPFGALVSWGVAWLMEHVKPLKDGLDWLAGNADEVAAHAATWQNVAKLTAATATEYAGRLKSEVATWFGASGAAYREHAALHVKVLEALSTAANGISYAVEGAGLLVGLVRGIVRDLIADFVATLAVRLPEWLAEVGLSLGFATPVVISQVSALVAKWVNKIQHFIRGLLHSLARLHPKLGRLGEILTGLSRYSDELAGGGGHGPPGGGGSRPHSGAGDGWHEGDPIPAPLDGGDVPTDAPLGSRYHNETDRTSRSRSGRSARRSTTWTRPSGRLIASSSMPTADCAKPTTVRCSTPRPNIRCVVRAGLSSSWTATGTSTRQRGRRSASFITRRCSPGPMSPEPARSESSAAG